MTPQTIQLTLAITLTQWLGGFALAAIVACNLAIIAAAAVARGRHRRYYTDY